MKNNFNKAFTLVELIVVITILAVLATVAFISFQGYASSSRDSVRLADLKNISKSFEINRTKDIDFPLPDKKIDISASGTIFQYQWELSQNILNADLNIFDGWVDPLTGENYWYAVNFARNKFQIIWFLENQESVANISQNITFADNSDKYVKSNGNNLGVILNENTYEIIVQSGSLDTIDIVDTTNRYSFLYWKNIESWDKEIFQKVINLQNYELLVSCKDLLDKYPKFLNQDGIYTISPYGENIFDVYCDMTTDWWWWTIIWSDGWEVLSRSLINEWSIPEKNVKWLNKYLISIPINNFSDELRVINVNDESDFHVFLIEDWMWDLVLKDSEKWYSYNSNFWFSGWKTSSHKCNFSIIVKDTQWCTTWIVESYPINGKEVNAKEWYIHYWLGSVEYSWQFKTNNKNYRLWWLPATNPLWNYYNDRISSYIMMR